MIAAHDIALANQLGTNAKSIRRWRKTYPREAPRSRDVETWRGFLRDSMLGPYSAQRHHGESAEAAPAPPAPTADTPAQTTVRRAYVDLTMMVGAMNLQAETLFPGHVAEAGAELAKINAAAERLYDLAGLVTPED